MTTLDSSIPIIFCAVGILVIIVIAIATTRNINKRTFFPVLHLDGFDDQNIEAGFSLWSWHPEFRINGEVIQKTSNENKLVLHRTNGSEATLTWKSQFIGWDAPQFFLNENKVNWIEPLKWHELLWCWLIPVGIGVVSFIGMLVAPFSFLINVRIFRTQQSTVMKYILTGMVSFVMSLIPFVFLLILYIFIPIS